MHENTSTEDLAGAGKRKVHLLKELYVSLCLLAVVLVIDHQIGNSHFGHQLHEQAAVWLQSKLQAKPTNCVVVVDIADIAPQPYKVIPTNAAPLKPLAPEPATSESFILESFTPRDKLEALIIEIAKCKPLAIGVDIDLAIEPELTLGPDLKTHTTNLFEAALRLRHATNATPIPVCFGMARNFKHERKVWLLEERYAELAASIIRGRGMVTHARTDFKIRPHDKPLPGLAPAMVADQAAPSKLWLPKVAKRVSLFSPLKTAPDYEYYDYPVDYSSLAEIMHGVLKSADVMSATNHAVHEELRGKLVLVGDALAATGTDNVIVPAHEEPVAGIFHHACAAYTLSAAPLWQLKESYSLALVAVASLLSLGLIYGAAWTFAKRFHVTTVPLTVVLTMLLIAGALGFAWYLARFEHLLWLEVAAVCVVLVLHCFLDILFATVKPRFITQGPLKPFVVPSK